MVLNYVLAVSPNHGMRDKMRAISRVTLGSDAMPHSAAKLQGILEEADSYVWLDTQMACGQTLGN